MKHKMIFPLLILGLVSACSLPASWRPLSATQEAAPNSDIPYPQAALKTQSTLADNLKVTLNEVRMVQVTETTWSNACLGAPLAGEACGGSEVPGLVVTLALNNDIYLYHTDATGENIRWVGGSYDPADVEKAAIERLSEISGIAQGDIRVLDESPISFSNTCLEVAIPGLTCAASVTLGMRITLNAGGATYAFNGTEFGGAPVLATVNNVSSATAVITYSNKGGQSTFCDDLLVFLDGTVLHYGCLPVSGKEPGVYTLSAEEHRQVIQWFLSGQNFEYSQGQTSGNENRLIFNGIGALQMDLAEQRQIAGFAQKLFTEHFLSILPTVPAPVAP
jgi:hypothetical protein